MKEIRTRAYTLRYKNGAWLAQVLISNDGMFSAVSDWGNFAFAWRSFNGDFRDFLLSIRPDYFGNKMANGLSFVVHSRKVDQAALRFAGHILPALQEELKREMELNIQW